ncbi:hypothetical protein PIB30_075061 [Stylosanthes scabra]|uniref:Uncharacterized protein n=1 Tax=Stylosanthes scabra TaxID=79078 RepID=A0ABU6ZNH8_9FABA|nr:hypothetical protein [Stylosanthes scabra]
MRVCGPSGMDPLSVRTLPCATRRNDAPSPPELETRWTWLSVSRRDAVCAAKRGTQGVGVRTHPRPRPGLHPVLDDGVDGMMSHMGADADPSVASMPEDKQSDESMAPGRSGKMDHRDADDRVMAVTNSGNTGDEEMVCDSAAEADNVVEAEMLIDNSAEAMTSRRTGPGVMADDTAAVMADNTENPDTAHLGQDDTEGVALAYIPGPWRAERQDIHVRSDP